MTQQVVQLCTNLEDPGRCVFSHDFIGNLGDESFPIRRWDWGLVGDLLAVYLFSSLQPVGTWRIVLLSMDCLKHE